MHVVGLVPARGGSQAIPRKNIVEVGGRPLLAHTADAALGSRLIDRVILSTDDREIAQVGRACGMEVPFLRPAELAADEATALPVVRHAVEWLERQDGYRVDAVVLLQPTSPLRTAVHVDEAVGLWRERRPDYVVSVSRVPHQFHPTSVLRKNGDFLVPYGEEGPMRLRRQDKPAVYARNGPAILVLSRPTIERTELYEGSVMGYMMDQRTSIDIDTPLDLELIRCLIQNGQAAGSA